MEMSSRRLEVRSFSCIDRAVLEIRDLTVIIGPQASGKSVICKLFYFFNGMLESLPRWISDSHDESQLQQRIQEEFCELFPPMTWGQKAFQIAFATGRFEVRVAKGRARVGGPNVKLTYSAQMADLISKAFAAREKAKTSVGKSVDEFERSWRVVDAVTGSVNRTLGRFAPEDQLYIPAGRSFFTSVGKIVTAFEDRTMLDPVVSRFGRIVTSIREHGIVPRLPRSNLLRALEGLIDGKIVSERGKQYLATTDGRSIPLSVLSSGQQELLPLLTALHFVLAYSRSRPFLTYIEEPEAHLFPSAQTKLVEMFAQMTNLSAIPSGKGAAGVDCKLILTTHSPYVLAKINNIIKAGSLAPALTTEKRRSLEKLIPSSSWIAPERVAAYAISDRRLVGIMDEYGMIDAGYIDSVSTDTGYEFDLLLELEASQ